jgi:23S rRNA (adenine1618-N6)-methyltransferase
MIIESVEFSGNFYWFSTLVSKQSNLKGIYKALSNVKATHTKTITMGTGNKSTRVVAWTFLTKEEQSEWRRTRWNKKAN